jgi:hypothetical protein
MCKNCGRVACQLCLNALIAMERRERLGKAFIGSGTDVARRRKCIAKKRGKDASGAEVHRSPQFVPLTTFDKVALKSLSTTVTEWDRGRQLAATDKKTYDYLRRKFCHPSNLAAYDVNTRPTNTVALTSLTEPVYFEMWRMGEPINIRKIPRGPMSKYTPQWFSDTFANQKVEIANNYGSDVHPATGDYFFGSFSRADFRRSDDGATSYRIKVRPPCLSLSSNAHLFFPQDFPTQKHWSNELKQLKEDVRSFSFPFSLFLAHPLFLSQFFSMIPLPNVFRPDGIWNMLAHTPTNALQPDLGPRLTCSWETNAKWPTTQLRSAFLPLFRFLGFRADFPLSTADCTDTASYMFWGGKDKTTGKTLRIRWDVFHAEDVDKVRPFPPPSFVRY